MSCSSTSSLNLLPLTPQNLSFSTSKPIFAPLKPISKLPPLSISIPVSFRVFKVSFPVSRVAVSDFDLDEDVLSDVEDNRRRFGQLKLFVGNLPFHVDSAALAELFERAGNVEVVEVIYDKVTGRSKGFGFVTMSSADEVEAAAQQFNGYEFEGRTLRVNAGPPPPKDDSFRRDSQFGGPRGGGGGGGRSFDNTNRIYVGNLSWGVDNLVLQTLFSEQGEVVDAKVVYDRDTGRSRGFGFVTYVSADEVNRAIDTLNGIDIDGRQIRVSIAEAPPKRQF